MKVIPETSDDIVMLVAANFRCFGRGTNRVHGNPLAQALGDRDPQFALGVDVKEVVEFVLEQAERIKKQETLEALRRQ